MEATTRELRLHTRQILAATDRGEEVIITRRGRRRARPTRWEDRRGEGPVAGRNPPFGLWSDRAGEVEDMVRTLRRGPEMP